MLSGLLRRALKLFSPPVGGAFRNFCTGTTVQTREENATSPRTFEEEVQTDRKIQIIIYSTLIFILFVLALVRSINYFRLCMQTSVELHSRLFSGVIRSPMSFFETNPLGRIVNRFAKDISVIDETLPPVCFDTIEIFFQFLGVVVIVSVSSPIMLIPASLLALAFYLVRKYYFATGRAIKRLEGKARSPVFSHIATTLSGLPTIRAFGMEAMFQKQFETYLDIHSSVWYLFLATSRWLGIVVDWLAIIFVAFVMLNCLLYNPGDAVAGLSLTSAMMLTSMLQWGVRQFAELGNQMVSVERILEYCDLPSEAPLNSELEHRPPKTWPGTGEIRIHNLSLKYGSDSPTSVLRNINCVIYGGEKIGIVGRTGAGKSSLLSAIFRIVEPSEGFIEIDGIMTNSIGLHDLRSKLSIIPQEPIVFGGTVRRNLDPFHTYPDTDIWNALRSTNLEETVENMPLGIYASIAEGGSNFSMGQKQLVCLARAVLRNNKILVLDEATSNVDPATDALIQRTLRQHFAACTVITIAHRLRTVMDSDRIIVLDAGEIVEMDEPYLLLQDKKSYLTQLVSQTGPTEAENLFQIAKLASIARETRSKEGSKLL